MARRAQPSGELAEAGELAAVEAIDRSGVVITSDGAFVRVLQVTPPNPLILAEEDRRAVAAGFCHLVGRLRAGQSLQFYVDARPIRLEDLLADARREVEAAAGPLPAGAQPARDLVADATPWGLKGARVPCRGTPSGAVARTCLLTANTIVNAGGS